MSWISHGKRAETMSPSLERVRREAHMYLVTLSIRSEEQFWLRVFLALPEPDHGIRWRGLGVRIPQFSYLRLENPIHSANKVRMDRKL